MINKVLFSSEKTDWETPAEFFDEWDMLYGFEFDVCASDHNAKCEKYFTEKDNALAQKWFGVCWMNPPYGRNITNKWVKKAYDESQTGDCIVVALLPARTDTKWFHKYVYNKPGIEHYLIEGRVRFVGAKDDAPFPSLVVVFKKSKLLNQ